MDRRGFLRTSFAAAGAALLPAGLGALGRARVCEPDPFAGGRLVRTLPLSGAGAPDVPLETLIGRGLDARRFTDLSSLTADTLVVPTERFFIRTTVPPGAAGSRAWTIGVGGLVAERFELDVRDLAPLVEPAGTHLIECAGNNNPRNFGLMSAARWAGVPFTQVIERARPLPRARRVLVSGIDDHDVPPRGSVPGASWIFSLDELDAARAFLALEMNGAPLPPDHGRPVRLVVPRWYGCASIKWVDEIVFLDDEAPATPHMKEFARRTHQDGMPALAREYAPAVVDQAAMPVRVEQWMVDGHVRYRVVGVLWGGQVPVDRLLIRFNPGQPYESVHVCPPPETNDTWTLWSHAWRPPVPGRYQIALQVDDPAIRTRRLDLFYYTRRVWVEDV